MHDLALLKRLTREQCEFVLTKDSCLKVKHLDARHMVFALKDLKIDDQTINDLLLSWARQLEAMECFHAASDFYGVVDDRTRTHHQFDCAIRNGLFHVLKNSIDSPVPWHAFMRCGFAAKKRGQTKHASDSFAMARELCKKAHDREHEKIAIEALRSILQIGLRKVDDVCITYCCLLLDNHKLTQPEIRILRQSAVTLFLQKKKPWDEVASTISEYGSESEKRACLNKLASAPDSDFESSANEWNIPLTERHWRLALGACWYTQTNGGSADQCVYVLRELVAMSEHYQPMLKHALKSARDYNLKYGNVFLAHENGLEIDEPLTLQELQSFLHTFGHNALDYYQMEQIPFALELMLALIGPKPDPASKAIAHAQPAAV